MISINIDVKKIDKAALYIGQKGTYLNLTLMDNRDGTDQYGNDGFVVQDIGKERRMAGEKGPILGNWKQLGQQAPQQRQPSQPAPNQTGNEIQEDDDIPF